MKNRNIFFAIALLIITNCAMAQNNLSGLYSSQYDVTASRLFPSQLDLGKKSFQLSLNYYLWLGNNSFNYGAIQNLSKDKTLSSQQMLDIFNSIKPNNIIGVGHDIQIMSLAFQFRTPKERKPFNFSLTVDDKLATDFILSKNLAKLIWQGNGQFRGMTAQLDPFEVNGNYYREFALGSSFSIFGKEHHKELKVGFRAKYLMGFAAINMIDKDFSIRTTNKGDTVSVGFDYSIKTSRLQHTNATYFVPLQMGGAPFNPSGRGQALDFSLSYYPNPHWDFVAGISDLGKLEYTKDVSVFSKNGVENYSGMIISNLFGSSLSDPNQLTNVFLPQETQGGSFKMPLSTKLNLMAEYKQMKSDSVKGDYAVNALFFTYIQGFSNLPGVTVNPFYAFGYTHGFGHWLNLGFSTAYGGYNTFVFGPFMSLHWRHTRLTFGSDNVGGFFFPTYFTGTDFTIGYSLTF